jgi:hypothetical protein
MSVKDILEVALTVIASLGGGGAIVFALSSYLGKRWADRALEKQKQDYAHLKIEFTNQLDIERRLQIELDAQGLLQKLRIESEFEKIKEAGGPPFFLASSVSQLTADPARAIPFRSSVLDFAGAPTLRRLCEGWDGFHLPVPHPLAPTGGIFGSESLTAKQPLRPA